MPTQQRLYEGANLDQLLAQVRAELGPEVQIENAERSLRGGIGGFFAREHFALTVAQRTAERGPETAVGSAVSVRERPDRDEPDRDEPDRVEPDRPGLPDQASWAGAAPARRSAPSWPRAGGRRPGGRSWTGARRPPARAAGGGDAAGRSAGAEQADALTRLADSVQDVVGVTGAGRAGSFAELLAAARVPTPPTGFEPDLETPSESLVRAVAAALPDAVSPSGAVSLAGGRCLAERGSRPTALAPTALAPTAPWVPGPAADFAALQQLGVPERLLTDPTKGALAVFAQAPAPPPVPRSGVLVLVGERDLVQQRGAALARRQGSRLVVLPAHRRVPAGTVPAALTRPLIIALGTSRLGPAADRRALARLAELGTQLSALSPEVPRVRWGVVAAERKAEDIAVWGQYLGGLDALAVEECEATTSPATALGAGVPVALLDGRSASPELWVALVAERAAERAPATGSGR